MNELVLQPGRDRSVRRRHPWVLSGAVASVDGGAEAGDFVRVRSAEGEALGCGDYSPRSNIRVRMLWRGKDEPPEALVSQRIAAAIARRAANPELRGIEALRLVNAEADELPGLSADVEVILETRPDVLRVPTAAVLEGDRVYVLDPDAGRLTLIHFTPGIANWAWTEVADGLAAGTEVVTSLEREGIADGVRARAEAPAP